MKVLPSSRHVIGLNDTDATAFGLYLQTGTPSSAPSAPVISLDSYTDTSITISWPAVAGAVKYRAYKNGVLVEANARTPYTYSDLTTGTVYNLTVIASGNGDSSASNTITQSAGYNPLTDSSVRLWLRRIGPFYSNIDGTGGTPAAGAACGRWGDSSSYGNHFSCAANDTTRPVVHATSLLGLDTDGVNDIMYGLSSLNLTATGFWVFIRCSYTASGTNKGIMGRWGGTVNQFALMPRGLTLNYQEGYIRNSTDSASFIAQTPSLNDGVVRNIGMSYEPIGALVRTWTNSTEVTAAVTSIRAGTDNVQLGAYGGVATEIAANIIEVLLGVGEKTLAERDAIRQFMVTGA